MDYAGNMSVCQTYVLVQSHFSNVLGGFGFGSRRPENRAE